ncbi:hypothetical protein AST01_02455 [Staphylococcus equorum]|uniref:helix-turn-helix domain-containing protein n=1 Tax=Staphylococcus equorum TaxID=246432 RepID=UPI000853B4DF|nr:helix-turn-helix transcriptional regulator [Staphylococcus equorum]OEK71094.1 hypothetical protein AST01_02455 [Staphylococcus equorum]
MDLNKENVGKRIKSIRLSSADTMEEFGQAVDNANKSLVSKWERGASFPNKHRMKIICEIGNVTVPYLLYGSYDEFVKDLINAYFDNHSSLDFIDRNDIIQHNISKYNIRKGKIFYELSAEHTDTNDELDISVWELKNLRDHVLYDEIANGLKTYLNRLNSIYSSTEGQRKIKRFKDLSTLLQSEFKDSEAALTDYMNEKLDNMYNEERLIYSEDAHKVIKNKLNEFFIGLLKSRFQHNKYNVTQNTIDFIYDDILKDFEGRSYKINFNKFSGWNDLEDETKKNIFNQIDEMASLLIEREIRN